jgi:hypothetical protein
LSTMLFHGELTKMANSGDNAASAWL